jgi:predicted nicotinamide N-methyase
VTARVVTALEQTLRRRFVTEEEQVTLGGEAFTLLRPRSAEELISEAEFDVDERLPYWADLWPSATVLAQWLLERARPRGTLLELGCGLGLVTAAALRAGYEVTATDYYEDALRFTRANAWRNAKREPATRHVDWRDFPGDLGTFDRVVAADVLYERPYASHVAEAIARTLARGGEALVADPGRIAVESFVEECATRGLVLVAREAVPFAAGEIRQTITVHRLTWGS